MVRRAVILSSIFCLIDERLHKNPPPACLRLQHIHRRPYSWPLLFCRGVYRSSPSVWQHPELICPPDSHMDDAMGAMRTTLQRVGASSAWSVTFNIPTSMAPITLAFIVSTSQPGSVTIKPKLIKPLTGRHFSALIGLQPGRPSPPGPSLIPISTTDHSSDTISTVPASSSTVNFSVRCRGALNVALVLLKPPKPGSLPGAWTCVEIALDAVLNRTGDQWHIAVPGLRGLDRLCYGWRVDGDVSWESGYRIQPDAIMLDPFAPSMAYFGVDSAPPVSLPRLKVQEEEGSTVLAASALGAMNPSNEGNPGVSSPLGYPLEDLRVMELDPRTFARGSNVTNPGTFLGIVDRIDHIRAVGVNAIVLGPCYATSLVDFESGAHRAATAFMCPDPALTTDPGSSTVAARELREMVAKLHEAGIEVIVGVDLTFTSDGTDANPHGVSLRGLDHAAYYRPNGVINCGSPAAQALLIAALRRWTRDFGVDGFCFFSAENLTHGRFYFVHAWLWVSLPATQMRDVPARSNPPRNVLAIYIYIYLPHAYAVSFADADGQVVDAPAIVEALCHDPILSGLKLIASSSNEALLPRAGTHGFPHWGLWQQRNQAFAADMLAFLAEGTPGILDSVAMRLTGSADVFGHRWEEGLPGNLAAPRRPSFSFNAVSRFPPTTNTLAHMAAEAAGVAGAAAMASAGPGAPLPSAGTIAKSLLLAVLLAQGVPVITQQDVEDVEVARFVGVVSRLRRRLAGLLLPPMFDSPRDIVWRGAGGDEPDWDGARLGQPGANYVSFVVRGVDGSAVLVAFNPHPVHVSAVLAPPPTGSAAWHRAVDTSLSPPEDAALKAEEFSEVAGGEYILAGKAALVLVAGPVVETVRK
jgi:pullulanase/glycogen debranching enzyme